MIYTVTFNPSLDYIVSVNNFQLGMTNRTATEMMLPGGKGINVSIVLKNLGLENTALGFVAGFTGDEIQRQVEEIGVNARFIPVDEGISRINLKLQNIEGTEINGQGPAISRENTQQLFEMLDQLQEGDVLVLAGSIPASMPDDIYRNILKRLDGKGILIAVDATGNLLVNVSIPGKTEQSRTGRNLRCGIKGQRICDSLCEEDAGDGSHQRSGIYGRRRSGSGCS